MKKTSTALALVAAMSASSVMASGDYDDCYGLPGFKEVRNKLESIVDNGGNDGLGNEMWASIVNRDGEVCVVAKSGKAGEQWPGSRVIAIQKANTGNAFSLPGSIVNGTDIAISSGNLNGITQPGGSLFGLQFSNPVDAKTAYRGNSHNWGTRRDPAVGKKIGGINVFGGGLALYNDYGELVGGIGLSGDTSCTDHIIAWKLRYALGLDNIPGGVSATGDDNLIVPVETNSFTHPNCTATSEEALKALPEDFPTAATVL